MIEHSAVNSRTDVGALWENFVIAERMKFLRCNNIDAAQYFWRTTKQQKIDLIEEINGKLHAYESKWNKNQKIRFSHRFADNYPGADMFMDFD